MAGGPILVDDRHFWELLGLEPGADRQAIKRAYHRLARRNHPDFFPAADKPRQGLRMITLNEAYAHLLRRTGVQAAAEAGAGQPEQDPRSGGPAASPEAAPACRATAEAPPATGLGFHREPAYAYYKQGFVHYSRAIHGIQALYRSLRRLYPVHFDPRDDAFERFAGSLTELARAHEYFQRVAAEHAGSVWAPDARVKLARVERFSELYRRILRNLREARRPVA
jgi:curved DNA-binding protein CbpA